MSIARLMQMARAGVPAGEPWLADLSNATYDSVSFSVAAQETAPYGLTFNNEGTKMYTVGTSADTVFQYSLSTAFNLSTASYDSISFSVAAQDTLPVDVRFNSDGTKMYMVGVSSDSVHQYSLSTAFNVSTASYDSISFSVIAQATNIRGIAFNSDGTKMYAVDVGSSSVFQYSFSTAFNLSTASYDSISFSVAAQDTQPSRVAFNSDGTKMYMVGVNSDSVFQYSLSTAFNVSTASYDSISFSVAAQETAPYGFFFKPDGSKMYIGGTATDTIYQYSTA